MPGPDVPAADSANLTAVAMASPSVGWASGFTLANSPQNAPSEPLLAAWNGHHWRAVPVGIGAAKGGRLDGLAVRSASDAWAVGAAFSAGQEQPLAVHWNGRRWSLVPAAGVPGYRFARLLSVAARSASDAWAVGEEENSQAVLRPLIEHWDGHRRRLTQAPDAGPQVALDGVAVTGSQARAVGTPFLNSRRPVVLRWTGHAWVVAAAPEASGDVALGGVTAVNSHDAWAVGTVTVAGGPYRSTPCTGMGAGGRQSGSATAAPSAMTASSSRSRPSAAAGWPPSEPTRGRPEGGLCMACGTAGPGRSASGRSASTAPT